MKIRTEKYEFSILNVLMEPTDTTVVLLDLPAEIIRACVRAAGKSAGVVCRHVCKWLSGCIRPVNGRGICAIAAEENHPEVLKWAYGAGYPLSGMLDYWIARSGTLETLKWLYEQPFERDTRTVVITAADVGNLDIVRWAYENGNVVEGFAKINAARNGHIHIMQYMQDIGHHNLSLWGVQEAVKNGHHKVLIWLHENGYILNRSLLSCAAENGHVDMTDWLWNRVSHTGWHRPLDMSSGVRSGNLDMCKFLCTKGIPITEWSMKCAEDLGYPHIVEWMKSISANNSFT